MDREANALELNYRSKRFPSRSLDNSRDTFACSKSKTPDVNSDANRHSARPNLKTTGNLLRTKSDRRGSRFESTSRRNNYTDIPDQETVRADRSIIRLLRKRSRREAGIDRDRRRTQASPRAKAEKGEGPRLDYHG